MEIARRLAELARALPAPEPRFRGGSTSGGGWWACGDAPWEHLPGTARAEEARPRLERGWRRRQISRLVQSLELGAEVEAAAMAYLDAPTPGVWARIVYA